MNRKLQIHVLKNIRDNHGWDWGLGWVMTDYGEAATRFRQSGFTDQEYFSRTLALIASGKVVSGLTQERAWRTDETLNPNPPKGYCSSGQTRD